MEGLKNNRYLIFALIFALLNMGVIFLIFGFQKYGDTQGYLDVIYRFQGHEVAVAPERVLRPLGPLLAVPFGGAGLIIQNAIFYLFSAFLIFKIVELIYSNPFDKLRARKQALLASLFFVTATPVIESGLAYLTDMGAWFFYLLSLFLTLLYFKTKKEGLVVLNGFLSGLGVLMKENGGLGALFFGLMILLSGEFSIKGKIFKILRFGTFFLIPVGILEILMFKYFHFTSLDWYLSGRASLNGEGIFLIFLRYLGQLFRILGILWIPLLFGLWQEWREKNWERIRVYLALIPASFSFLLWSTAGSARSVFIFAPLGILLASFGCRKIKPFFMALIMLVILGTNYYFCSVNREVPFTDIIAKFLRIQ